MILWSLISLLHNESSLKTLTSVVSYATLRYYEYYIVDQCAASSAGRSFLNYTPFKYILTDRKKLCLLFHPSILSVVKSVSESREKCISVMTPLRFARLSTTYRDCMTTYPLKFRTSLFKEKCVEAGFVHCFLEAQQTGDTP